MEDGLGDMVTLDVIESHIILLQRKLQEDFAQMESIHLKAQALSGEWLEAQRRLKSEERRLEALGAPTEHLRLRREETEAALEAELSCAFAQVKEKEETAAKLRADVATLERRVEEACREMAHSAARLEEGAHSARLALEASLRHLVRILGHKAPEGGPATEGRGDGARDAQEPPLPEDHPGPAGAPGRGDCPEPEEAPVRGDHPEPEEAPVRGDHPGPQEAPVRGDRPEPEEAPVRGDRPGPQEAPVQGDHPEPEEAPVRGDHPGPQEAPVRGDRPGPQELPPLQEKEPRST